MQKEKICLGAIVSVHGIKGEVKIKSFTGYPEDIDSYGELENEAGDKTFCIKVVGHSKELLRARVKGVEDRNAAEALVGTGLYVDKDLLPELDDEEFYHINLVGLDALSSDKEKLGTVAGVYNFGAGDLLEVNLLSTGKAELYPFTETYVPVIDIDNGYVVINELNFGSEEQKEEVENEG